MHLKFEANVLASDEAITIDFSFYLSELMNYILQTELTLIEGTPAEEPDPPVAVDDALELAPLVTSISFWCFTGKYVFLET